MAFNQRFPDAVPALDTAGLVKLISDPQKAAELWARYEQARTEYEALRAAVTAEAALLVEQEKQLVAATVSWERAAATLKADVEGFRLEKEMWVRNRIAGEAGLKNKADALHTLDEALNERGNKLDKQIAEVATQLADLNKLKAEHQEFWTEQAALLDAREAAIAKREARAEELAKLLKAI